MKDQEPWYGYRSRSKEDNCGILKVMSIRSYKMKIKTLMGEKVAANFSVSSAQYALEQRSENNGSRAKCGSFQDCIRLSGLQTNLSRLSSNYTLFFNKTQ